MKRIPLLLIAFAMFAGSALAQDNTQADLLVSSQSIFQFEGRLDLVVGEVPTELKRHPETGTVVSLYVVRADTAQSFAAITVARDGTSVELTPVQHGLLSSCPDREVLSCFAADQRPAEVCVCQNRAEGYNAKLSYVALSLGY